MTNSVRLHPAWRVWTERLAEVADELEALAPAATHWRMREYIVDLANFYRDDAVGGTEVEAEEVGPDRPPPKHLEQRYQKYVAAARDTMKVIRAAEDAGTLLVVPGWMRSTKERERSRLMGMKLLNEFEQRWIGRPRGPKA